MLLANSRLDHIVFASRAAMHQGISPAVHLFLFHVTQELREATNSKSFPKPAAPPEEQRLMKNREVPPSIGLDFNQLLPEGSNRDQRRTDPVEARVQDGGRGGREEGGL